MHLSGRHCKCNTAYLISAQWLETGTENTSFDLLLTIVLPPIWKGQWRDCGYSGVASVLDVNMMLRYDCCAARLFPRGRL